MVDTRPATVDDIDELVRLRGLLFTALGESFGPPPVADAHRDWREACADALRERLADERARLLVVDGDGRLACCGVGVIDQRLPTPYNPGGLVGHVFGVVTDPAYRRRGYARAVMTGLLRWFDANGLWRVDLYAAPHAQALYRSLGFDDHPDPVLSRRRA